MLFRVFRWLAAAEPAAPGGALHVPRQRQGAGRHDSPARFGAYYAARSPESAVAEAISSFRGRELSDEDLELVDGSVLALAGLDDDGLGPLADLDDPAVLVAEGWRPSAVASRERLVTQAMAVRVFEAGGLGLSWWSTLDAAWTNVTLFAERTLDAGMVTLAAPPERLSVRHPAVELAADRLVIPLVAQRPRRRAQLPPR